MATATQTDIAVTTAWVDLVTVNGSLASVDCSLQNKCASAEHIFVVFGGSQPTSETAGTLLNRGDSVNGNAAAIWVRGPSGGQADDKVGVTLL